MNQPRLDDVARLAARIVANSNAYNARKIDHNTFQAERAYLFQQADALGIRQQVMARVVDLRDAERPRSTYEVAQANHVAFFLRNLGDRAAGRTS